MRFMVRLLSTSCYVLLFLALFTFALKNQHLVPTHVLGRNVQLPLAWLLLVVWLIGVLAGLAASAHAFSRWKSRHRDT